ncbi:hypothetical protein ALO50_200092 [Pseudomonas syringae pv. cerasicola]|nr:hypothetical protein ALO50_200092 [Pseudomonas syringae pv. cerasicola]
MEIGHGQHFPIILEAVLGQHMVHRRTQPAHQLHIRGNTNVLVGDDQHLGPGDGLLELRCRLLEHIAKVHAQRLEHPHAHDRSPSCSDGVALISAAAGTIVLIDA